jgi:RNA polymerase sigma-70 factor, ECF subfamily
MEELYARFERDIRSYVWRQLGPPQADDRVDDRVYEILQSLTNRIRSGEIREPKRFMPYARELARRQAAELVDQGLQGAVSPRDPIAALMGGRADPAGPAIQHEGSDARHFLGGLPQRDREVLVRFYLQEQTAEEICRALQLSETQFRLIKSRAKARYSELGRLRHDHPGSQKPGDSTVDPGTGEALQLSVNPEPSPLLPASYQHAKSGTPSGQILAHAAETFGSAEKADHWLNRPNHVFQGRTPRATLATDPQSVEIELSRIDHGVYI